MPDYDKQRPPKQKPHVSLKSLRIATGKTLDAVAAAVTEELGREDRPVFRGTIAAIESGTRGASTEMLNAIATVYGLDGEDIFTDYEPRKQPPLRSVANQ